MKNAVLLSALAFIGGAAFSAPAATSRGRKSVFIYVGPAADAGYNTSMDERRHNTLRRICPA